MRTDCQKVNCPKGKRRHPGVRGYAPRNDMLISASPSFQARRPSKEKNANSAELAGRFVNRPYGCGFAGGAAVYSVHSAERHGGRSLQDR